MIVDEASAKAWIKALPQSDEAAFEKLEHLCEILEAENKRQNLIAAATVPHIWQRHIADSAQLLGHVPRGTSGLWMDLGSGAGFPGMVIGILCPELELQLVESRNRRVEWLEAACSALAIPNVTIVGCRLEKVATTPASVISARAFAPLPTLLELSARFSTASTTWVLPKGRSAAQEVQELRGWTHTFHVEQSLTDAEAGIVVGHLTGWKGAKQ